MKRILLVVVSFGIMSSLAAQTAPIHNGIEDDQDPNDRYPKKSVDTPHFQSPPAEGLSGGADADKYCASLIGGKIAVIYKGKTIMENVTLSNGIVIFKDGTVVLPKGQKRVLKKGECLDKNGENL